MSGAFEQAWLLLKSVFQPSQGKLIGEGANQMVYGMGEDPDVTKVGHGMTLNDMYLSNRSATMYPNLFASQRPIRQTMDLPLEALSTFEGRGIGTPNVLSTQERGEPLQEGKGDIQRGKELAAAIFDNYPQAQLLEGLGLADIGPRNWMMTQPTRGLDVRDITGDPSRVGQAVIHDPMFYGARNPTNVPQEVINRFLAARGAPRRLGIDYQIPEEQTERFARKLEELPFHEFVDPYIESVEDFYPRQVAPMDRGLNLQEQNLRQQLGQIGVAYPTIEFD
jgi:hypothetical protein|tara:strand:- start:478 stop:1314 length:837 start_codon:yes stop_codon:yes gene_type:complete